VGEEATGIQSHVLMVDQAEAKAVVDVEAGRIDRYGV